MTKAEPKKSSEMMGANVKQPGEANIRFFAEGHLRFSKKAGLLLEIGVIGGLPQLDKLTDTLHLQV